MLWRVARGIWPCYRTLARTSWSAERILRFQQRSLRKSLAYASRAVPFHRERAPDRPEQLSEWPLSSRHHLQSTPLERLLATGIQPSHCVRLKSSGSTGEPLAVYYSTADFRLRFMYFLRMYRAYGIPLTSPIAQVGCFPNSRIFSPGGRALLDRRSFLSIKDPVDRRLDLLLRARPVAIFGFATELAEMAERAKERGLEISSLRVAIGVGECMDEHKRAAIADGFRVTVRDSYGAVEAGNIAYECPSGAGSLHVHWDNVVIEVLRDGRPAPFGEVGEVALTHLHYRTMPLVRYRLGDLASLLPSCPCGSRLPVIQRLHGRQDDVITLRSGARITPLRINRVLLGQEGIRRYRLVQARPGVFSLEIDGSEDALQIATTRLRTVLGPEDGLTVRHCTLTHVPGTKERTILVEA